ncbi:serine O-acetyltransferase [Alteromonas flava]|uniref:serine O-acetyltransferase n=1 Tax=Alteromonas flava TaxID=2048003 RepID=UPI000C2957F4|nr:DapH/DapD/GlmU-related protein [Alteromonas flava]
MKIKDDLRYKREFWQAQGFEPSRIRVLMSDGTSANVLYRMTSWFQRYKLIPFSFLCQWFNKVINGCVIGAGATFGKGLILMHPVGIVVNSKVIGGERVIIESGVVIGDEKGKAPVIGNDVFIGAGAKIVGGVRVGNNVKIGANAVVVKDVEDDLTVVGIPARPIGKSQ